MVWGENIQIGKIERSVNKFLDLEGKIDALCKSSFPFLFPATISIRIVTLTKQAIPIF